MYSAIGGKEAMFTEVAGAQIAQSLVTVDSSPVCYRTMTALTMSVYICSEEDVLTISSRGTM